MISMRRCPMICRRHSRDTDAVVTLSGQAKSKIANAAEVYVSSASIWEASIKAGIGKLDVDVDELVMQIEASGFRELPISARHAAAVRSLPGLHNDPFDRLLVAQAICEPLRHFQRHLRFVSSERSVVMRINVPVPVRSQRQLTTGFGASPRNCLSVG
jgi:PIN domain nuclease of toxin-antitoxin system